MDPLNRYTIPLSAAANSKSKSIGGKALHLASLQSAGYPVPDGFCIPVTAYKYFVQVHRLDKLIHVELGRKAFEDMRWEEIWDAALRIRSAFLKSDFPEDIRLPIGMALKRLGKNAPLAVRSTAPKEDTSRASFAGLHESVVGVVGEKALLNAIRQVWASLWSDAALLYQHELGLDPFKSAMAVLVQRLVEEDVSGVAFGRDPRSPDSHRAIIEAVPGLCQQLVDGSLDPDRWVLKRPGGKPDTWRPGKRADAESSKPLLTTDDVAHIYRILSDIEDRFGWPPDIEWTGRRNRFTLLQARPITTVESQPSDEKSYYLTLRPGAKRLQDLAHRVAEERIPELTAIGRRLADEDLDVLTDKRLAETIIDRQNLLNQWKKIYRDEFIPFAHGVRSLAAYYNDAVNPDDPYEFLGLLRGQSMIAFQRNQKYQELADILREYPRLLSLIEDLVSQTHPPPSIDSEAKCIAETPGGNQFLKKFRLLEKGFLDISYQGQRLKDRPDIILNTILQLATRKTDRRDASDTDTELLENRLLNAVGPARVSEAKDMLRIGRLSWKLRDDDNILINRLESQFLRSVQLGAQRLKLQGRLDTKGSIDEQAAPEIIKGLGDPSHRVDIISSDVTQDHTSEHKNINVKARQLTGQPAAPGIVTGSGRIIQSPEDLGLFRAGEILVCDAIQPNMTHLVPLASAIVERRGGMLIHGAIIAREMGIPCVNGIPRATELLQNGEWITVDGNLGIVTVGKPEFDLELMNNTNQIEVE